MLAEALDSISNVVTVTRKWMIRRQLLEGPAITHRSLPLPEDAAINRAILHLRHSLSQRTQFKVFISALARRRSTTAYTSLRKCTVTVNTSTPEQAELAIEAILSFAASLDGKWLAPAESTQSSQPVDTAMLREHSVNPVNESGESAEDSQSISKRLASEQAQAIGDASQGAEEQAFSGS